MGQYADDAVVTWPSAADTTKVKTPPTTFKSLSLTRPKGREPGQRIDGGNLTQTDPRSPPSTPRVLANGGSLSDIAPGVSYFKSLKQAGNFVPVEGTPATVQSGQTPILIWWDYLLVLRGPAGRQELQDRHPVGRRVRLLLRPGHQRDRA